MNKSEKKNLNMSREEVGFRGRRAPDATYWPVAIQVFCPEESPPSILTSPGIVVREDSGQLTIMVSDNDAEYRLIRKGAGKSVKEATAPIVTRAMVLVDEMVDEHMRKLHDNAITGEQVMEEGLKAIAEAVEEDPSLRDDLEEVMEKYASLPLRIRNLLHRQSLDLARDVCTTIGLAALPENLNVRATIIGLALTPPDDDEGPDDAPAEPPGPEHPQTLEPA